AAYELELPPELKKRRIHPTFHVSLLREHVPSDDDRFPGRNISELTALDNLTTEVTVHEIVGYRWKDNKLSFFVTWSDGHTTEEEYQAISHTPAFEEFCETRGIDPKRKFGRKP
ncbi:hypothetical protein AURDEDRAFT_30070, partial [Auricularia subglabra TFB-10046 SS5]